MRKIVLLLTASLFVLGIKAQENKQEKKTVSVELPQWVKDIKLSGYGMLQYQAQAPYRTTTDEEGNIITEKNASNTFNIRLLRLMLDGKIGDVAWRAQFQGSGSSAFLVDLYAEWQKYREIRVKAGQFKRSNSADMECCSIRLKPPTAQQQMKRETSSQKRMLQTPSTSGC